jgi:hypothetical protein
MSATVTRIDRGPDADLSRYDVYAGPFYGERPGRAQFAAPGQLWQRVRDHHSFLAAVLTPSQWERIAVKRNELGTHAGRGTGTPLSIYGERLFASHMYGQLRRQHIH